MRQNFIPVVLKGLTIISLLGFLFGSIPAGHAQSSQTWSDPVNLSNSGSSTSPSIVVDSNGLIHVIWIDKFDGYKYVRSSDGGKSWTSPETVTFPFSPKNNLQPEFFAGRNGEIFILWLDDDNNLFYCQAMSTTFDVPSTWIGPKKLSDSVNSFDAVVSNNNILHLGYVDILGNKTRSSGVYYEHFGPGGWSVVTNLYSSKYLRSLEPTSTNVSLAVSSVDKLDHVIVAWDDRFQKRIFWVGSSDGGNSWDATMQISGPEDYTGSEMPYNIKVSANGNKDLLLWQVGIPGSRCTQYSQWSLDGGAHFEKPVKLPNDFAMCPTQSKIVTQNKDFSINLLNFQDDISLVAWDGNRWSKPQSQRELSTFLNPLTFDNVLLACQNASFNNETLYVVGCDTGTGDDIWFRSLQVGSLKEWFPPASSWTFPVEINTTRQMISSLSALSDEKNNVFSLWVQNPVLEAGKGEATIVYSRWDGEKWSSPTNIIAGVGGVPTQLTSTVDAQGRLLLSWVEGRNGDLYFSWANSERADLASEWFKPQTLPSPSDLNSSPNILVDDSGRIVIVYTVPMNEQRGVYIVQSTDLGRSWSQPTLIFDAVAADWSLVDQPQVSLSGDGSLHVIFTRSSLRETDQSKGLYYSRSSDGGITWSQPETVSDKTIGWSRIIASDPNTIHRIWQENNGVAFDLYDQASHDQGKSWENSIKVVSKNDSPLAQELTGSADGKIYIMQSSLADGSLVVETHAWDGAHWTTQEQKELKLDSEGALPSMGIGISHQGILHVLVSINYPDLLTNVQNKIISFSRSLVLSSSVSQPLLLQIAIPSVATSATATSSVQASPTELSPLANLGNDPPSSQKNKIGLIMVGTLLLLIVIITWPRKKSHNN